MHSLLANKIDIRKDQSIISKYTDHAKIINKKYKNKRKDILNKIKAIFKKKKHIYFFPFSMVNT